MNDDNELDPVARLRAADPAAMSNLVPDSRTRSSPG